jgi:hypothetical protein
MRLSRAVLLAAGLLAAANVRAETLRQVLQQNGIPISGFLPAELQAQVSSSAADSNAEAVFLAYPAERGEEMIGPPLSVVVYHRTTRKVVRRAIAPGETSDECTGSVLGISEQAGYILVETHINPSASCTMVLDADLRVRHTLFGWSVARLGTAGVLLEEDEVHFAPVHPLRLEVFDLAGGRRQEVYPPDGDALRAQFSRELRPHLPSDSWCREHNHPCDASSFDEELGEAVFADAAGTKFGLIVTYDAGGFGEDAGRVIGSRSVLYIYRRSADSWTYCQERLSENEVESRQRRLKDDLEAVAAGCMQGTAVKVTPKDSPFSQVPAGGRVAAP